MLRFLLLELILFDSKNNLYIILILILMPQYISYYYKIVFNESDL